MRIAGFFLALVAAGVMLFYLRSGPGAQPTAALNSCINNLRQLDGAKEQWQLENKLTNGTPADVQAVLQYVKGQAMPICAQGGSYTIGPLGQVPTCSNPSHALPTEAPTPPQPSPETAQ